MPASAARTIADPTAMAGLCRACRHRRRLPEDARDPAGYIACHHPATAMAHANPLAACITGMGGALPYQVPGLDIVGDPHAITMGWFSWPFRFLPDWLVRCDGFLRDAANDGEPEA